MDDKIFALLEKMYIEVQDMKANMATKQELNEMKANMATKQELNDMKVNMATKQELNDMKVNMATKQDLSRVEQNLVRLENKMDTNHKALYDGYKQSIEGINEIRQKLDKLTDKVENQEIKLQVLKSVK